MAGLHRRQTLLISLSLLAPLVASGCQHPFPVMGYFQGTANVAAQADVHGEMSIKLPLAADPGPMIASVIRQASRGPVAPRIALIDVDGVLLNQNREGLYDSGENPVAVFREKLEAAASDVRVAAVVLRIHSPGGGVTACDIMTAELERFRAATRKPVVACLMDVATSGAYYLALGADRIVAHPTSITGGVGVVFNHVNLQDAMAQLNVADDSIKAGPLIDMGNVTRPLEPETKQLLQGMADGFRQRFVDRLVAQAGAHREGSAHDCRWARRHGHPGPGAAPGGSAGLHRRHPARGGTARGCKRCRDCALQPRRQPGQVALCHRSQPAQAQRRNPLQLSRARPHQAADLPVSLAARPDAAADVATVSEMVGAGAYLEPHPGDWPVLVTGAGGFVGGHIARHLARVGHRVRGLTRKAPHVQPDDPAVEWFLGDLRDPETRHRAVHGVRGVIHTAGWVSLGRDPRGLSQAINVDATRHLLEIARRAAVERFVLTSTLHTLAAGTLECPADEATPWNLACVDSPYARSKRHAEMLVRQANDQKGSFTTVVLCPGMILGARDVKPTSTQLVHVLARTRVALLPGGGIPILDTRVAALAHRRALTAGEPGARYALAGPYLGYVELARLVRALTGRPRWIVDLPDGLERPLRAAAGMVERMSVGGEASATTVAGGFLRLHVSGARADACFHLVHPPPIETIRTVLES